MDTTIAAAIIAGGVAAAVAIAGFGATILTNTQNIKAARDEKLRDRRADVYIAAIAAVYHRQASRLLDTRDTSETHVEDERDRRAERYLAVGHPPDWHNLEARLLAFASEPVTTAVQASATAHERTIGAYRAWHQAIARRTSDLLKAKRQGTAVPGPVDPALEAAVVRARKAAEDADDALLELIRKELQGKGPPLEDWSGLARPVSGA